MDVTKNRNKFIGGSDVAAILGLNRYKTAYEVWEEKKHNIVTFEGNNFTEWGNLLEPVIIGKWERDNNKKIFDNNIRCISDIEFIGCHPDGFYIDSDEKILVEVKTVSSMVIKHWQDEIPLEYYCQLQHNMFCTKTRKGKFIIFVTDARELREIDFVFDADFVEKQNAFLIEWWNRYIIGNETPQQIAQDLEKVYPENISIVECSENALQIVTEIAILKDEIKKLKEQQETKEDLLKQEIGEHTDLMNGLDVIATWRPYTQVRVDSTKLREEQPELFKRYCKEIKGRKFLIKL